ncbi:MAG: preprotein translocase subunit SecA [bacterium]|nr:preprotein translocase subunit SecA [bacterium]
MIGTILKKVFGTKRERDLRRFTPLVEEINALEPEISKLSDAQLRAKTDEFKKRFADGETLEDILFEAFAVVREVGKRTLNMRHFDVQLMGGIALHEGKIAEMKTGEGKTLVATLPTYLNALTGKGVHIVTVNDYLANRDREWMGPIYEFLGLSVGVIQHDLTPPQRQQAYACDITYGTNNEFGFDYLRDNMVVHKTLKVQRGHNFAIVDEVDSILVDEARTPLIISGPAEESTDKYYLVDKIIPYLRKEKDYQVDEKLRTASLTEEGVGKAEKLLKVKNLYDPRNMDLAHHVVQALKAHTLFKRDVEYMCKEGEVVIVDEFTGRLMPGRRYSEGLHQALEAKEGLRVREENQTLATITFQNYFRMYNKLAGMTGTADTEAEEFDKIYKLDVIVIPANRLLIRHEYPDVIYKGEKDKFKAVIEEIVELYKKGRPVLVGTISVEKSERLSALLKKEAIPHQVLNAKYHEMEAQIIAQAGRKRAITIATNMAGRGTDIVLGGNPPTSKEHDEVVELGGLHILGTERHESRRIDNQLRGRAGRQGDPGSSKFYLSLEDDLMRIFGSEKIQVIMEKLGLEDDQVIEHPWINKAIERAQKQVEGHNFDIRKRLLEYDDVMNQQRSIIYQERDRILNEEDISEHIQEIIEEVTDEILHTSAGEKIHPDDWDKEALKNRLHQNFGIIFDFSDVQNFDDLEEMAIAGIKEVYKKREDLIGKEQMNQLQRSVMIHVLDNHWKDHLHNMDYLREGINLRAYGQKDPLIEYRHESYRMFDVLVAKVKEEALEYIFKIPIVERETPLVSPRPMHIPGSNQPSQIKHHPHHPQKGKKELPAEDIDIKHKLGRNDPCPCGSGKKFKKCCLEKMSG